MNHEARTVFGLPLGDWLASFFSPRYLPIALSLYVAMYAGLKLVLVVFNAAGAADRWIFELTPAFLLDLPDVQLVFLSTIVAAANAVAHVSVRPRDRVVGLGLSALMAVSLVLSLYASTSDPFGANPARLVMLLVVLAIVPMDQRFLVTRPVAAGAAAEVPVPPVDQDLESLLEEIGEEPAKAEAADETVRGLEKLEALAEEEMAEPPWEESEEEIEEEAEFAIKELDAFEKWIDKKAEETPPKAAPKEETEGDKDEKREGSLGDRLKRRFRRP